jgi:hypothetical protein
MGGSNRGSVSNSNSNGDGNISRLKKFQICIWVTIALTFFHLGTKPMVSPPPPEQIQAKNNTRIPSSTPAPMTRTEVDNIALSGLTVTTIPTPLPIAMTKNQGSSPSLSPAAIVTSSNQELNEPQEMILTTIPSTVVPTETQFNVSSTLPTSTSSPTNLIIDLPTISPQKLPLQPMPTVNTFSFSIHTSKYSNFDSLPAKTKAFVQMYCDLKNLKEGSWYPSGDDEWQLRAPYLIVAGTWNSGVNHLAQALLKHPHIDPARIHDFFLPKNFKKYISVTAKTTPNSSNNSIATTLDATTKISNVHVFAARDRMYHVNYSPSSLQEANTTASTTTSSSDNDFGNSKSKHIAMDISPGLLFHARLTSYSIQCVSPWTKIVILLRNPIDRLYQQWVYSKLKLKLVLSLEDWVARELKKMQSVGLIRKRTDDGRVETPNDASEKRAWTAYQAHVIDGAPLGRSMYVMQLDDWIQTYLDAGKNPKEEMIIISSERLEDDKATEYLKIIDFLGLESPDMDQGDDSIVSTIVKPTIIEGVEPMSKETRSMLQQFFQPYNKRLTTLLQEHGFAGDWDKIWS